MVGAQLKLAGQASFARDSDKAAKKVGVISKAFTGMGVAGVRGGSMLTGALTAVLGPVGILAQGVLKLGKNIIGIAASGGSLRGIKQVFDNLTSSYGINADILDRLRSATKGAVTDFDLMKQANKALVGAGGEFGKMFGEKLPLLMATSREAAKAQGLSVQFMFDSLVTGIKRSSPMILDNLGFQFSLTEANEKYAASIGKTVKELSKEEKQIALLNAVTEASATLIEQTGGSMDTASKQALAWTTAMRNTRDLVAIELEPVLMSLMGLLGGPGGAAGLSKAIVMTTRAIVQKIVPAIDAFGATLRAFISGPLMTFINALRGLGRAGVFKGIGEAFMSIFKMDKVPNFDKMGRNIRLALVNVLGYETATAVSDRLVGIFTSVATRKGEIVSSLRPLGEAVQEGISSVVGKVSGVKGFIGMLIGDLPRIANAFKFAFAGDVPGVIEAVSFVLFETIGVSEDLSNAIGDLAGAVVFQFHNIAEGVSQLFAKFSGFGFDAFFSTFEDGSTILGGFLKRFKVSDKVANAFGKTINSIVMSIAKFVRSLGKIDAGKVFDSIGKGVKRILPTWLKFQKMFSPLGLILTGAQKAGIEAFEGIWDSISQLIGNMGELLGNYVSLAVALFEENWPKIEEIVSVVFEGVTDAIAIVFTDVIPMLLDAWNVVLEWVNTNWPAIQEIIMSVFGAILNVIMEVVNFVVPFILEMFQMAVDWVRDNWPLISRVITKVLDRVLEVVQFVLDAVNSLWLEHGEAIMAAVQTAWDAVRSVITGVMENIQGVMLAILQAMDGDWKTAWETMKDVLAEVWEGIKTVVSTALSLLLDPIIIGALTIIQNAMEAIWKLIKLAAKTIWEAMKNAIKIVLFTLRDAIVNLMTKIQEKMAEIWNSIKTKTETIWSSIKTKIETVWSLIRSKISTTLDIIMSKITEIWGKIKEKISTTLEDIKALVKEKISAVAQGISDSTGKFLDAGKKIVEAIKQGISDAWQGLTDWFGDKLDALTDWLPGSEPKKGPISPLYNLRGRGKAIVGNIWSGAKDEMVKMQAEFRTTISPIAIGAANNVSNTITNVFEGDEFNLTTQSVSQPGTLALDFQAMEMSHL